MENHREAIVQPNTKLTELTKKIHPLLSNCVIADLAADFLSWRLEAAATPTP